MSEGIGNDRYRRGVEWARTNLDAEGLALHHKVNDPTPWIIDVRLPEPNSREWFDLREWCDQEFGPQSWPIHNRPGAWYIAGATVFGHTDMGFATEELMKRFIAQFPDRVWPEEDPDGERTSVVTERDRVDPHRAAHTRAALRGEGEKKP